MIIITAIKDVLSWVFRIYCHFQQFCQLYGDYQAYLFNLNCEFRI